MDDLHVKTQQHLLSNPNCNTHYELWIHLSRHEDQTLVFLQVWVVVEDQLTGSIFTHCLEDKAKRHFSRNNIVSRDQVRKSIKTIPAAGHVTNLDINEGGEVKLMFGPLTHKELITFLSWQSVEELGEMETMGVKQEGELKSY